MLNPVKVGARLEKLSEGSVARLVAAQYERTDAAAGSAVREMVVFGAILEAVDRRLELSITDIQLKKQRNQHSKETLKGWLEKHCPSVNYKTAMAYYSAAKAVREVVKLAEDKPLLALMGEEPLDDAKMEKKRLAVMKLLMTSSLNALRRLLKGGEAGRPEGEASAAPATLDAAASARMLWASPIGYFAKHRAAFYAAASLLSAEEATLAKEELEMALGALKRRLDEVRG